MFLYLWSTRLSLLEQVRSYDNDNLKIEYFLIIQFNHKLDLERQDRLTDELLGGRR